MSEEKKKILAQIDKLPDEDKAFITGYAAGVIAANDKKGKDKDETRKEAG